MAPKFSVSMIKFNFNANINTNGNKIDKKGLKITLIVFSLFILVGIAMFVGFWSFAFSRIDYIENANVERYEQKKAIAALPVLKCAVYADQTITSPASGEEAALYLLRVGNVKSYIASSEAHYGQYRTYENFDYNMVAGYPKGTKLSINGKLYPIDFKLCIMDSLGGGETHFTKDIYSAKAHEKYDIRVYKTSENLKMDALRNVHPWIKNYYHSYKGLKNILVQEYVFKNGDSVYIKGKIEHNKIVPFVEHMLYTPSTVNDNQ
ncbi:hypothetical protein [Chryseobacterium sp. OSA05B]|uniref:hypothetical protein n=1 Tax=Chryseobacterium sp. OSA05B TaxID=2862650 RepID=UPI001CBD2957|nr:hypothetical protein [Chryseobacterium sp. OSA05B]